jgi:hypothetical protein
VNLCSTGRHTAGDVAGDFRDPAKLQKLKISKYFDPLRRRDDFKKRLQELEAAKAAKPK